MSVGLNFEAEPFAFESYAWEGEVSRTSPAYIRWVQQSLNKILGLRLAEDGLMGTQTRSAVRSLQQRGGLQVDGSVGPQTEKALVTAGVGPPPAAGAPSPSPGPANRLTPALVKRETSPPAETLYLDLALGIESPARPMTGIFIPESYRAQPQVDLILYLHGVKYTTGFKPYPTLTIDDYWDKRRFPYFTLREGVNESRKNVILVAPTLGARAETGWLTRRGGFATYLDHVLAALAAHGPYKGAGQPPRLGNVILSCHSGGGLPMRLLALSGERYTSQITECWGFDCTYNSGDDTEWARWAKSRPDARLYIYYIAGSRTQVLSLGLKQRRVPNVSVAPSPARGHMSVPIAHWRERIQAAPSLRSV